MDDQLPADMPVAVVAIYQRHAVLEYDHYLSYLGTATAYTWGAWLLMHLLLMAARIDVSDLLPACAQDILVYFPIDWIFFGLNLYYSIYLLSWILLRSKILRWVVLGGWKSDGRPMGEGPPLDPPPANIPDENLLPENDLLRVVTGNAIDATSGPAGLPIGVELPLLPTSPEVQALGTRLVLTEDQLRRIRLAGVDRFEYKHAPNVIEKYHVLPTGETEVAWLDSPVERTTLAQQIQHWQSQQQSHASNLWKDVKNYLESSSPEASPVVTCSICTESELVIPGLQPRDASVRQERAVVLPCGHMIGLQCWAEWVRTWFVARGQGQDYPLTCPMCASSLRYRCCQHQVLGLVLSNTSVESALASIPPTGPVLDRCLACFLDLAVRVMPVLEALSLAGHHVPERREAQQAALQAYRAGRKDDMEGSWACRIGFTRCRGRAIPRSCGSPSPLFRGHLPMDLRTPFLMHRRRSEMT